jgi:hypothetical protein
MDHIDKVAKFMDYIAVMSAPSKWPLPGPGVRFVTPAFMIEKLARHPLTKDCYPTAMGFYPEASGHRMRRERHDDNLLIYCAAGKGFVSTENWSGAIDPGDLVDLLTGHGFQPHEMNANGMEPVDSDALRDLDRMTDLFWKKPV